MIGACTSPSPTQAPASTQLPDTPAPAGETAGPREVTFQTEDGVKLSGTLFGQGGSGVVLSHMFPTDQTSWHAFAKTLAGNGYLALAYDFRGYGKSGGEKHIDQIDSDVRAAVAFLKEQGAQRIVLVGASMGGTASAKVAGSAGAAALVVLSSPQSFNGLEVTEQDLKSFRGPSLWMGSRGDAATTDTEAMHAKANEPKTLHIYEGSAHGTFIFDTANGPDLSQRIIDFLVENAPPDR
jgi:pimeloyl-ACP methyl ester carboxylesterase